MSVDYFDTLGLGFVRVFQLSGHDEFFNRPGRLLLRIEP
jgi:hypothetical protein